MVKIAQVIAVALLLMAAFSLPHHYGHGDRGGPQGGQGMGHHQGGSDGHRC